MTAENKFKPAGNCKFSNQCKIIGECIEAVTINQEISYEKESPGSSSLKLQVDKSECVHPQAVAARSDADSLLA